MARKEPQNIDAEISVLGCGFLEKTALDKIMDEVTDEMFYSDENRIIYKAMKNLHTNNVPVDVATVCNELDKNKDLAKVGGVEYITDIIDSVPSTANLNYYINIIFEKSILRNLINKTTKIQEECYNEQDSIVDIVENAERNILSVYNDKLGKDIRSIQDVLPEVQKNMEALAESKTDFTGIRTGYYDFDNMTRGLQKKQVIIVAGRPGCGKSAFALNVALNAAIKNKNSIAFFSLEMGVEEIAKRMFGCVGKIDGDVLKTGKLKNNDWKKWNEAMSELSDTKFFIDDSGGLTVSEIRRKCRKLKNSDSGLDLIVIDYLQLLSSSSKYAGQRVQEVSEISRDIKKLAMELDVPVIALAQLSRSVEQRKDGDKTPKLSDLRESGSIEQDADIVLFLHSDEYGKYDGNINRKIKLIIAKHRAGQTGAVDLIFKMNTGSFDNYINKEDENE
ncbi:replicative DNA helicase [Clostridium sp. CAG:1000]|jgi:replicative DNA helicase|nr:replicative DNA helicase [Clostridium sp. CAG:1000]